MLPSFVLATTWHSIARETLQLIGHGTSTLIAIVVRPSFVLATAWRSIVRETSRPIVGAISRSIITYAATRFAANNMRPSAITTDNGQIVDGGGAIATGSSL